MIKTSIKFILFFLLAFNLNTVFALNIPGEVPIFDITKPEARLPAVDLIYKGKIQSASELRRLEANWIKKIQNTKSTRNLSEEEKESLRQNTISKLTPAPQDVQKNWIDKLFLVEDGFDYEEKNGVNLLRGDNTKDIFKKIDDIAVNNNDTLDFIDVSPFKANKLFDFRVLKKDKNKSDSDDDNQIAKGEQYRIFLGPTAHNIMLRKTLLRKLGFKEPGFKYLSKVKVKFELDSDAIIFLDGSLNGAGSGASSGFGLSNNTNEDPMRWVTNVKRIPDPTQDKDPETGEYKEPVSMIWDFSEAMEGDEVVLELQDVVIYKETASFRLALGYLQHDRHKRKRIYNSLLLAYNLVDVPESVNSFSPIPFSITKQEVVLTHNYATAVNEFTPDIYDLKWMARKLSSFSRKDFEHMVAEAHYPKEVAMLLTELLIARRNYMQKYFLSDDIDCKGDLAYSQLPYYCLGEDTAKTHPKISSQFSVNLNISHGKKLVKGKLKVDTRGAEYQNPDKWWVGYGTRFSYHDIESPLVFSEILSYFRSILQSSLLDAIINKNLNDVLRINNESKITDKLIEQAQLQDEFNEEQINNIIQNLNNGNNELDTTLKTVPISFYTLPTASAQLILNRNIVIGSQSGVDNQIQLVDTFGYILKAGLHSEVTRVENLNLFSNVDGRGLGLIGFDLDYTIMRRWVHLRPIKVIKVPGSEDLAGPIKKSLKESYSKILIPKMLRDFRNEIDDLPEYNDEATDEEKEAYKEILLKNNDTLNKYLKVGESLIISNTVGPSLGGSYLQNFSGTAQLYFKFLAKSEDLSRVHILRKNEDQLVIYKTKANQLEWEVNVEARKFIPVAGITFKKNSGKARTWFHSINNFTPEVVETSGSGRENSVANPAFQDGLEVLIETITSDSIHDAESFSDLNLKINKLYPPYVINHDFNQGEFNFRFLFFNLSSQAMVDEVDVYSPYKPSFPSFENGETTRYLRVSRGVRKGLDFQTVAQDIVNYVLNKNDVDGKLQISTSSDPADTLFGKSEAVSIVLDARVSEPNPGVVANLDPVFEDPFLKLHYTWKGGVDFGLSQKKTKKLIKKINKQLNVGNGQKLFNVDEFSKVEKLQLYRVGIDIVIYKEGFFKLFERSPIAFESMFKRAVKDKIIAFDQDERDRKMEELVGPISQTYFRCQKYLRKKQMDKFSKQAVWLVLLLQQHLDFEDFISIFEKIPSNEGNQLDAIRNFYIKGYVTGFRKGDERIDPILASEFGMPRKKSVNGSSYDHTYGELEYIKNRIGISDGEFYLNWLLRSYL